MYQLNDYINIGLWLIIYNSEVEKGLKNHTLKKFTWSPGLVAHTCNPGCSGGRDQEIAVQSQPRQIVQELLPQKKPL
jgi:hypothetical protein